MNARPTGHAMRPRQTLRPQPPRAFTLIELLIAMTLTLMLVYAIAQFYAYVGETVRDGRAQIEMGGQLRAAVQRLQQDLAELTVRVGGKVDTGAQQGYLELDEGRASDSDMDADSIADTLQVGDLNNDGKADSSMLGDCDDVLSMTIRSQGEPFVGRQFTGVIGGVAQYAIIQSNLAEVIWFTSYNDLNGDGAWQPIEPRYLLRRQLLILPNLTSAPDPADPNDLVFPYDTLRHPGSPTNQPLPPGENIFHHNDVSAHYEFDLASNRVRWVANSLGDLSRRENRFIHINFQTPASNGIIAANANLPNTVLIQPFNMRPLVDSSGTLINDPLNLGSLIRYSLQNTSTGGQFLGEDKMLSNVLAFDVRVYDPFAVLRADNSDIAQATATLDDDAQGVLSPSDPGYAYAVANGFPTMGNGAFVDLWYTRGFANIPAAQRTIILQNCNSAYSWAPNARNFPGGAVWDTWTMAYEKDGLPQVPPGYIPRVNPDMTPGIDWLVDGLDNSPNINGVDDPSEAETQPPYPSWIGNNGQDDDGQNGPDDLAETSYPQPVPTTLRGIEVRIRMYEPGTRQTRQQTVATDFIPE